MPYLQMLDHAKARSFLRRGGIGAKFKGPKPPDPARDALPDAKSKIMLQLQDAELIFKDGSWRSKGGKSGASAATKKDLKKLKQENSELKNEVHMLKFKQDLLIDMLAAANLENQKLLQRSIPVEQ